MPHIREPSMPSDRKFGWFVTSVLTAAAAYLYWKNSDAWASTLVGLAVIFAVTTVSAPRRLTQLNRLWYTLGLLLGKISSPIVLGLMFFVLLTPVSLAMRLSGRDALKMKKRNVKSYWVDRNPTGPAPDSFKNQF